MNRSQLDILSVKNYLLNLQRSICAFLEQAENNSLFLKDPWEHKNGGGGITCVLENGNVIEKAGVNFSHVFGNQLPPSATAKRPELKDTPFQALGISIIVHPRNPYAPTCHANLRLFMTDTTENPLWWIGGGFDLTPYYGFDEDCIHWHQTAKKACEPFGEEVYPRYKQWADRYFYIPHRQEHRGIGGIFFDDLNEWGFSRCFDFIKSVGNHFIDAYQPILQRRKNMSYGEQERTFQLYRRGRYAEFNLVYDRGTLFGLQSGGRIESILVSLPPNVSWHYQWSLEPESPEAALYNYFLIPKDWV